MKYLVQWQPYKILGEFEDGYKQVLEDGQDFVKSLTPDDKFSQWDFSLVDWELVLKLHEEKDYRGIFKMHNDGNWSDEYYCCDFYSKYVDKNVGIFKASRERVG